MADSDTAESMRLHTVRRLLNVLSSKHSYLTARAWGGGSGTDFSLDPISGGGSKAVFA